MKIILTFEFDDSTSVDVKYHIKNIAGLLARQASRYDRTVANDNVPVNSDKSK